MGNVVKFQPGRPRSSVPMEELFERWKKANAKAHATADIQDAIAAGKAWAAWLESFKEIGP
ncbi:hypothetical protein ACFOOL_15000 [Devosia honganensis]|uniref:Uncharacterized protein n=1 Tax=Devosia honganensis TaxID=1610527 RepID=A0ABV7X610_9HYPH